MCIQELHFFSIKEDYKCYQRLDELFLQERQEDLKQTA